MEPWKTVWDRLPAALNYVLILVAGLVLAFLFPDAPQFKYSFRIGGVWHYEDLYAPFDFAIPKSAESFQMEKEEVEADAGVYYRREDSISTHRIKQFEQDFSNQLKSLEPSQFGDVQKYPSLYLNYGSSLLQELFRRGIIAWDSSHIMGEVLPVVQVISGNVLREVNPSTLLTVPQAHGLLRDSLPHSGLKEPAFLLPILADALTPNLYFDASMQQKQQAQRMESLSPYSGMVRKGELIVPRGGVITDPVYQMLLGYKEQYTEGASQQQAGLFLFLGALLLTAMVLGGFFWQIHNTHPFVIQRFNHLVFLLFWVVFFAYLGYLARESHTINPYLLPFALAPIVLKNFYDRQIAWYVHLATILLAVFITGQGLSFVILQLVIGALVIAIPQEHLGGHRFLDLFLLVVVAQGGTYMALEWLEGSTFQQLNWTTASWLVLNSFLLLLAYPLTSLFERIFGLNSVLRLRELNDTNRPLLQELAARAPGTFQHSLQVAHLSEAAARNIGADFLLARVGALYHDIGKMQQPEYFIENQNSQNVHDGISPLESAEAIIRHVTEGVQMAKKHRLPRVVADFIRTHHGTTRVEYFFRLFTAESGEAEAATQADLFRYPGPRPRSREAAIVMLADTIEAACKSIKNPTALEIDQMIDKLIQQKVEQNQLSASELSFSDLEICRNTFRQQLRSIYHLRVEYPS